MGQFMPIIPFLRGQVFDPELIEAMSMAFTKACDTLGLVDRADPIDRPDHGKNQTKFAVGS